MNHRHKRLLPLLALGLGALGCQPTHAQITEPAAPRNGLHSLQAYEDENRLTSVDFKILVSSARFFS